MVDTNKLIITFKLLWISKFCMIIMSKQINNKTLKTKTCHFKFKYRHHNIMMCSMKNGYSFSKDYISQCY